MEKIRTFLNEMVAELRKVTWPSMPELRESTFVVIVTVLLITFFIFLVDQGFNWIMKQVFRTI